MSSNSDNSYLDETDYFYSLDTLFLTWEKAKFIGFLPTSNIKILFRSLWAYINSDKK